jgi:hypothetical protein
MRERVAALVALHGSNSRVTFGAVVLGSEAVQKPPWMIAPPTDDLSARRKLRDIESVFEELEASFPDQSRGTHRYYFALQGLQAAVKATAPLADATFRRLHNRVLGANEGRAIADCAPTEFKPPSKKCRERAQYESQDPFAHAFTELHVGADEARRWAGMAWRNSNARKWATPGCHVEVAKLFCPKLGDTHESAIKKRDFNALDGTALFNMLSWCSVFTGYSGADGLGQAAAKARNTLKHDDTLQLSEEEFDGVLGALRALVGRLAEEDNEDVAKGARLALRQLDERGLVAESTPHGDASVSAARMGP